MTRCFWKPKLLSQQLCEEQSTNKAHRKLKYKASFFSGRDKTICKSSAYMPFTKRHRDRHAASLQENGDNLWIYPEIYGNELNPQDLPIEIETMFKRSQRRKLAIFFAAYEYRCRCQNVLFREEERPLQLWSQNIPISFLSA